MNDLLDDLVIRILGFLSSSDIHRTLAVNKRFQRFFVHIYLWKYLCHRGAATKSLIRSLLAHNAGNTLEASVKSDGSCSSFYSAWKECEQYRMISRQLEGMSKLEKLKWNSAEIRSHNATNRLERMEAHSMTLILDRFAVIINGWGQSELNDVTITDCSTLPVLRTIRVDTIRPPRFRYGFSTTYYRGRLFVYGGCCNGGYSGDINDLYVVELTFLGRDEQVFFSCSRYEEMIPSDSCWDRDHSSILSIPPDGFKGVEAVYSSNKTLIDARRAKTTTANDCLMPTSRGYHTAVVVQLDGRDQLLVWGGLHARRPTGRLELLDLTHTIKGDDEQSPWTAGQYSGMEPNPRFGHSCILLHSDDTYSDVYESCSGKPCPRPTVTVDRLVFIGGSDGNDLIRNGRELREIHVLHIVRRSPSQSLKGQSDELVWSRPTCTTLLHADVFPGRCHCSALVGNRIILFGGGAHHSNATSILDVCTKKSDAFLASTGDGASCQGADLAGIFSSDEHTLRMVDDSHSGPNKPLKRCSAASVLVGKYFMIMGGFNSQRSQLGDVWLLDVSYETTDGFRADAASAALRAQQTSSTSLSLVGVEGDQPEQEEAAQSGGTSSFQNIIQMAQLGIIDWSATTTFYDLINMLNNENDAESGDDDEDDEEEEDNMDDDDEDYDEDGDDDDEDYHDFDEQDYDNEEEDDTEVM